MFLRKNRRKMGDTTRMWYLDTLSNIVGTVIGIALTFGVTFWIEYRNARNDNKKATLMVLENVIMIRKECKNAYDRVLEAKPILEEIIELTPERVATMPDDSVYYYMSGFPVTLHVYQDFARTLLNSNFDIVRSTDNYIFLLNVHYFYSVYDRIKALYEKEGPDQLLQDLNNCLTEISIDSGQLDTSPRWDLMQVALMNKMKVYIKNFLDSFIPNLTVLMDWLEDATKLVAQSCEYKAEELEVFIKNAPTAEAETQ